MSQSEHLRARVRLRNPEYEQDGLIHVEPELLDWTTIPFIVQTECIHSETMCVLCLPQWANDYQVEINGDRVLELVLQPHSPD